ncbi:MAG: type II toxin-antitoxin system HicA family toxin [Muribaculaceae bacterium]|nr:type II toxin-antitoxin system HicA family toxin [Muribaculaceae bacterium]
MSKIQKLVERLLKLPKDFNYEEAKVLLTHLGFKERNKGKTSGSRVEFTLAEKSIQLHRPHPDGTLKHYQLKQLIEALRDLNLI